MNDHFIGYYETSDVLIFITSTSVAVYFSSILYLGSEYNRQNQGTTHLDTY